MRNFLQRKEISSENFVGTLQFGISPKPFSANFMNTLFLDMRTKQNHYQQQFL